MVETLLTSVVKFALYVSGGAFRGKFFLKKFEKLKDSYEIRLNTKISAQYEKNEVLKFGKTSHFPKKILKKTRN